MKKITDFIAKRIVPASERISRSPWVSGITNSFQSLLPVILVGALAYFVATLKTWLTFLPDMSVVNSFTLGVLGLLSAFLMTYKILEKMELDQYKLIAGFTALITYLIFVKPDLNDAETIIDFGRLGAGGIIISMIVAIVTVAVFKIFDKSGISNNKTSLPDFVYAWFTDMLPVAIVVVAAWVITYLINFDAYAFMQSIFNPLINIGHSYVGVIVIYFLIGLLYSFGISPWCLTPVIFALYLSAMSGNAEAVAQGLEPNMLFGFESCAFLMIGGSGSTLALNALMCIVKSQRLKSLGRATIVPGLLMINEPLIYGVPVAMNLILMVPMIISSLVLPSIYCLAIAVGFIGVPFASASMALSALPFPLNAFMCSGSFVALLLAVGMFGISLLIWYPFFKIYDNQCVKEEALEEAMEA